MGLSASSLTHNKHISVFVLCLSHCKVSCHSPCCTESCGEDKHRVFNIDTHENVNSDSDEDEDADGNVSK